MSLILDALRKMEQERKARCKGEGDIRPDVLSYRGVPQKPPRFALSIPLATAFVVLVALAAGWFFLKTHSTAPNKPVTTPVPLQADSSQPVSTQPPPQPPVQAAPVQEPLVPPLQTTPPKTAVKAPPPAVTETSSPAGITISGIAWQEERSLRRAVINGALVGEGAEVAGARIVEIRENLVKFSKEGQSFEVVYSSGINN